MPDQPPEPLTRPDFSALIEYVTYGTRHIIENNCEPKDFQQYVYERAIEAIYGPSYWDWINKVAVEW